MKNVWMKRLSIGALVTVCVAGAHAGYRSIVQVFINDTSKVAAGNIVDTRRSPDAVQYIDCSRSQNGATCRARNYAGLTRTCYTNDPAMKEIVRSMTSESQVVFRWDDSGLCTDIYITDGSEFKD
jgi:hypothetical protein